MKLKNLKCSAVLLIGLLTFATATSETNSDIVAAGECTVVDQIIISYSPSTSSSVSGNGDTLSPDFKFGIRKLENGFWSYTSFVDGEMSALGMSKSDPVSEDQVNFDYVLLSREGISGRPSQSIALYRIYKNDWYGHRNVTFNYNEEIVTTVDSLKCKGFSNETPK